MAQDKDEVATKGDVEAAKNELRAEISDLRAEQSEFKTEVVLEFAKVNNRLDGIDERLDGIDERLDGFESMVRAGFEQVQHSIKVAYSEGGQAEAERIERHDAWIKKMEGKDLPNRMLAVEATVKSITAK